MPVAEKYSHTTEEIYALPEGKRAELIDGQIYDMAPPGRIHQELVQQLSRTIGNYIAYHNSSLLFVLLVKAVPFPPVYPLFAVTFISSLLPVCPAP